MSRAPATALPLVMLLAAVGCSDTERPTPTSPNSEIVASQVRSSGDASLGRPLAGLSRSELATFARGRAVFVRTFTPRTGLGPLFNGSSCAECHAGPAIGGVGAQIETHETGLVNGTCDELEDEGGFVIQDSVTPALRAALGFTHEPSLPDAVGIGKRTTPELFGRGLLEAVPDEELLAIAQGQKNNGDGIAGRPHLDDSGHVGRFGRKAPAATILAFNADAFLYEMGVTNPLNVEGQQVIAGKPIPPWVQHPGVELSQQDLDDATAFVRYLAPPTEPSDNDPQTAAGRSLFSKAGCASCHVPTLVTGDSKVAALARRPVRAYTDLLLHDMGPGLADICFGSATPSEFRTEPLMGLRHRNRYLHDGSATSVEAAIDAHGGQGTAARARFRSLTGLQRAALLSYLKHL